MNLVSGYSVAMYGAMIADDIRMNAYVEALRRTVTPQSVVLDIGAGIGTLSLLACRFGARHVYAVESDESIQVARELAQANGCADHITFLQDVSTRVKLPERCDVIVSDLRGALPLYEQMVASIADARERHLAPGGVLIPQSDTVWACPVEAPEAYDAHLKPWGKDVFGLDFSSQRWFAVNAYNRDRIKANQRLAQPQVLAHLDHYSITDPNVHARLAWHPDRNGTLHGYNLWFSTELSEGVGYSSADDDKQLVYGMVLLLLTEPVEVEIGSTIEAEFAANLVGGNYIWQWNTRIFGDSGGNGPKASFRQSTLGTVGRGLDWVRKRASLHVPEPNDAAQVDMRIVELMDGRTNLESIARRLAAEFPALFPKWQDALVRVSALSAQYSR